MSFDRKNSKMGVSEIIPIEFFRVIFQLSVVLVVLILLPFLLLSPDSDEFVVSIIALICSGASAIGAYLILYFYYKKNSKK